MRQPLFVKISSKKSVCFVLFMVVIYNAEFIMERSCKMGETNGKKLLILIFNRSIGKADR